MNSWKSIETAPKDGNDILLCLFGNTMIVAFWDNEGKSTHKWQTADGISYHNDAPTHWMPLPEFPK